MKSRICIVAFSIVLLFLGALHDGIGVVFGQNPSDDSNAGQTGALSLKLSPPTYGMLGSSRTSPLIAGEKLRMVLDVSGLNASDAQGYRNTSITTEIYHVEEKKVVERHTEKMNHKFIVGGTSARYPIAYETPRNAPAGKYVMRIEVLHHETGEKKTVERPFEILSQSTFGILDLKFSQDENGFLDASGTITLMEPFCITGVIGGLKDVNGHVHFKGVLSILDEDRKPVNPNYLTLDYEHDYTDASDILIPLHFSTITPNRTGKFILEIKVTDVLADKTVTYELPLAVLLPPELPSVKK